MSQAGGAAQVMTSNVMTSVSANQGHAVQGQGHSVQGQGMMSILHTNTSSEAPQLGKPNNVTSHFCFKSVDGMTVKSREISTFFLN